MMSDLTLIDGLDQPVSYDDTYILTKIDDAIHAAIRERDPDIAFKVGLSLIRASQLSGIALAKLVYELQRNWKIFELDVDFVDRAAMEWGMQKVTLNRYISIWEMRDSEEFKKLPEEVQESITQRPLADQNAIAATFGSGYPIPDEKWEKLANATDTREVEEVLREVKGVEPRPNSVTITLDRDGTLRSWPGGDFVGYLAIKEMNEKPNVKKAIQRIINNTHIREQ